MSKTISGLFGKYEDFEDLKRSFYNDRKYINSDKMYNDICSMKKSHVVKTTKEYQDAFNRKKELITEGKLVLGAVVMANELLFQRDNKFDCPAMFVYSHDDYFEKYPYELKKIAYEIFELRNMFNDGLLEDATKKEIADMLNDEYTPKFNIKLPEELTYGRSVYMTTLVVVRDDIKNGILYDTLYPLIIKEGILSGAILNYRFYDYDSDTKSNGTYETLKKILTSSLIIIVCLFIGLNFDLTLNISFTTGVVIFLLTLLWTK